MGERVSHAVPAVEIANNGNGCGMGCPDGKACSWNATDRARVGPQMLVKPELPPLIEEVEVFLVQPAELGLGQQGTDV